MVKIEAAYISVFVYKNISDCRAKGSDCAHGEDFPEEEAADVPHGGFEAAALGKNIDSQK